MANKWYAENEGPEIGGPENEGQMENAVPNNFCSLETLGSINTTCISFLSDRRWAVD